MGVPIFLDFNIGEWERSLTEIPNLEFDIAVCSHNGLPVDEALNGCTQAHVQEERQFIRDLRNAILAEFQKGTSFLEVPKAVRLPQYEHWAGYDAWHDGSLHGSVPVVSGLKIDAIS